MLWLLRPLPSHLCCSRGAEQLLLLCLGAAGIYCSWGKISLLEGSSCGLFSPQNQSQFSACQGYESTEFPCRLRIFSNLSGDLQVISIFLDWTLLHPTTTKGSGLHIWGKKTPLVIIFETNSLSFGTKVNSCFTALFLLQNQPRKGLSDLIWRAVTLMS